MDWMKIGSAVLLVMFIVVLWPQAKSMLQASAQETDRDWGSATLPIALVCGFVVLLMLMV